VRLLPFKDATRDFNEGPGAMKGETFAPRRWDVGEVFLDERGGRQAGMFEWYRVQADLAGNMGKKMGGISHGIAQNYRIEIDEDHAVAR
jgi:hypothetical protein